MRDERAAPAAIGSLALSEQACDILRVLLYANCCGLVCISSVGVEEVLSELVGTIVSVRARESAASLRRFGLLRRRPVSESLLSHPPTLGGSPRVGLSLGHSVVWGLPAACVHRVRLSEPPMLW